MNVFSSVRSLALTGSTMLTQSLPVGYQQEAIAYPTFVHKGIILNLEDFGGPIEIIGSTFSQNAHYIPSIYYTSTSQATYQAE